MIRFTVFDRWGNQIGVVQNVIEAMHRDELNGEDSLTLIVPDCSLVKGQRIVWRDKWNVWHEHTVNEVTNTHSEGAIVSTVYCENSISELYTDYLVDLRMVNYTAAQALEKALSTSRWVPGIVDITGVKTTNFYHISAREAVADVVDTWGCELRTDINIAGESVSVRKVSLVTRRGEDLGKRFEWSKDLSEVRRTVEADDVCTALYGYGAGIALYDEEGATGGYSRRITFGEINNGQDWVGNDEAKEKWGLPDGDGGVKHTFGKVEFDECEDMHELLELTKEALRKSSVPHISYTASVVNLADTGLEYEDCRTGDTVAIIDRDLDERLEGRIQSVERYLFNDQATVITLGNITRTLSSLLLNQSNTLSNLRSHATFWDNAATASDSYINQVINSLNTTMNADGGYVYMEPGEGITTYDKPLDENPTKAIQLKGGGFRIANSKKANGEWDWRTFGTGDGFVADEIIAGTIHGQSSEWNLNTGQFKMTYKLGNPYLYMNDNGVKFYKQDLIVLDMSPTNPFGIYKTGEYYVEMWDGSLSKMDNWTAATTLIGGLMIDGNNVVLQAQRVGVDQDNYITTGILDDGRIGASFMSPDANYLDISSLHLTSAPGDQTTGVGFSTLDQGFLDTSVYPSDKFLRLYPPTPAGSDGQVFLAPHPTRLMMTNTYVELALSNTNYLKITDDGLTYRNGNKGFGFHGGTFYENLSFPGS